MHKITQNNSSNSRPYAALQNTLYGSVDVALDGVLEGAFVGAIEHTA